MTKGEFVLVCTLGGYCGKHAAEEYAKDRNELTDDDIIEVYRQEQEKQSRIDADRDRFGKYQGTKSTKRYYHRRILTEREGS